MGPWEVLDGCVGSTRARFGCGLKPGEGVEVRRKGGDRVEEPRQPLGRVGPLARASKPPRVCPPRCPVLRAVSCTPTTSHDSATHAIKMVEEERIVSTGGVFCLEAISTFLNLARSMPASENVREGTTPCYRKLSWQKDPNQSNFRKRYHVGRFRPAYLSGFLSFKSSVSYSNIPYPTTGCIRVLRRCGDRYQGAEKYLGTWAAALPQLTSTRQTGFTTEELQADHAAIKSFRPSPGSGRAAMKRAQPDSLLFS